MNCRILLIYPPSPFLQDEKVFPPVGLMYLMGAVKYYLPPSMVTIELLDLAGDTNYEQTLTEHLGSHTYDIIGVTIATVQYPQACRICRVIRKKSRAHLVIGGPHVTALPDTVPHDTAIQGEGELAFVELIREFFRVSCTYDAAGTLPSELKGRCIQGGAFPVLWHPWREHPSTKAYTYKINGIPSVNAMTARGCPNSCRFCMRSATKFRLFPVSYVHDELRMIVDAGHHAVNFLDDTFTYDTTRLIKLCNILGDMGITWRCTTRVDCVDKEILSLMHQSGCYELAFGLESGSQVMLDAMNKQTTVAQNFAAVNAARAVGVKVKSFFMIGFPGETRKTIQETRVLMEQCDNPQIFVFSPTVGCDTWKNPEKYGIRGFDKYDYSKQWRIGKDRMGSLYIDTDVLSGDELKSIHLELLKDYCSG